METRNFPKMCSDHFMNSLKLIAFAVFVQFRNNQQKGWETLHPSPRLGLTIVTPNATYFTLFCCINHILLRLLFLAKIQLLPQLQF